MLPSGPGFIGMCCARVVYSLCRGVRVLRGGERKRRAYGKNAGHCWSLYENMDLALRAFRTERCKRERMKRQISLRVYHRAPLMALEVSFVKSRRKPHA